MIRLIIPNRKYINSYVIAQKEYKEHNVITYNFCEEDILKKFENYRKGINLKPGYVLADYYWLVDNNEFIGEISIRHKLTESLLKYGGHIGYGIKYSMWGKGYGTIMLKLALKEAKKLGINKVLITCDADNYGSAKVIENNNGILENKVKNIINGKEIITRRYWIDNK